MQVATPKSPGLSVDFSNLVRSDFWFLDGNIVIVAGNAAFKVHRGQLQRHSDIFGALLSLPQPRDANFFEGCLHVELHDNPADVFYFLSALYDGLSETLSLGVSGADYFIHRYFKAPHANDFMALAGVLRLSSKYFVERLRERCVNRLDIDWPSTLAGWDRREQAATDSFGRYVPRESCPHPILVIQLALDLGIDSILPAAFYDLARYGPSKIMSGVHLPPSAFDEYLDKSQIPPSVRIVHLPHRQLLRTLRGRERIQRYMAHFIASSLQSRAPAPDCAHSLDADPSRPCHESFYFIMLNVLRSVGGIACGRDADTLYTLTQAMDMLSRTDFSDGHRQCGLRICQPCKLDFAACATKAREDVWAALPRWFGLTGEDDADETFP